MDGLSLGSSDKDIKCHHLTFYYSSSPLYYFSALNTTPTSHIRLCQHSLFSWIEKKYVYICTGKSLSADLLFAEHGENMLCTKIVLKVRNNFCTQHVLPRFEPGIFMYWTCNSINNLLSYCGLVDAKIRASEKIYLYVLMYVSMCMYIVSYPSWTFSYSLSLTINFSLFFILNKCNVFFPSRLCCVLFKRLWVQLEKIQNGPWQ